MNRSFRWQHLVWLGLLSACATAPPPRPEYAYDAVRHFETPDEKAYDILFQGGDWFIACTRPVIFGQLEEDGDLENVDATGLWWTFAPGESRLEFSVSFEGKAALPFESGALIAVWGDGRLLAFKGISASEIEPEGANGRRTVHVPMRHGDLLKMATTEDLQIHFGKRRFLIPAKTKAGWRRFFDEIVKKHPPPPWHDGHAAQTHVLEGPVISLPSDRARRF